jgi:acyl carrier protein
MRSRVLGGATTGEEIVEVVQRAVRSEAGDEATVVTSETMASDVDGWDSLAHGRIMRALEVMLGARIDIEKTYWTTRVGELIPIERVALERSAGRIPS